MSGETNVFSFPVGESGDTMGSNASARRSRDNGVPPSDAPPPLNAFTPTELDAKLQAIEARMDARVAEMTGRLDSYLARMDERDKRLSELAAERDKRVAEHEKRMDERHGVLTTSMADLGSAMKEVRTDAKSTRYWMVGTAIATVLALAGLNYTLLSNMVASFEAGKNTATAITQATEQMKQQQEQLKALQEALTKQATSTPR